MKKIVHKLLYIGIISLIYIAFNSIKVEAASASLSATTTEPTEGQSVTVTANVTAGAWNLKVSGAGKSETLYGYTQSASNSSDSKSITFTAGSAGTTYNFTLTGDMTDINSDNSEQVNKPLTITVKAKDNASSGSGSTGSTGGDTNTPATKSTVAKLSNFGINPKEYDFKGFKKDTYTYTHEVPNSVSEITVYATPVRGATVTSGTGKVALKEGDNTIKVVVTAEAGNTQTYTLTIKRRTAEEETTQTETTDSTDATLKSLGIKPEEYDFSGFKKDKTEYSVQVPKDVEEIEVYAEATSEKAQISGTGKVQLKNGKNKIIVQVTAEDGTTQTYTIEVIRGEAEAVATNNSDDGFGLSSLEVNGMTLTPNFKTGTYEYAIELSEDLSSLDIEAIATDEDATIEILGNENLQLGENTITILVRNEKTDETATYQIIVNKNLSAEEKMSWLKPSTWGREEIIKVIIIAVLLILIIIAIILKIKLAKEKKIDEDLDLPGGEELDKALAEHQELAESDELNRLDKIDARENQENLEKPENTEEIKPNENEQNENGTIKTNMNYLEDIARSKNYEIDYSNDYDNNTRRKKGKHF